MSSTVDASVGLGDIAREEGPTNGNGSAPQEPADQTWRERITVSIARSRKIRGANYVQIATVDPKTLEPRCRTVVFRGFTNHPDGGAFPPRCAGESTVMRMITDARSSKVAEVTGGDPAGGKSTCEMVWWFAKSNEQYRIRGQLVFVGGGQFEHDADEFLQRSRREQWGNLSDMAREQFYWKQPGLPYSLQNKPPAGGRDEEGKVLPPPDTFLLMLLHPSHVDYLRLTDNFRQVDHTADAAWHHARVNP